MTIIEHDELCLVMSEEEYTAIVQRPDNLNRSEIVGNPTFRISTKWSTMSKSNVDAASSN